MSEGDSSPDAVHTLLREGQFPAARTLIESGYEFKGRLDGNDLPSTKEKTKSCMASALTLAVERGADGEFLMFLLERLEEDEGWEVHHSTFCQLFNQLAGVQRQEYAKQVLTILSTKKKRDFNMAVQRIDTPVLFGKLKTLDDDQDTNYVELLNNTSRYKMPKQLAFRDEHGMVVKRDRGSKTYTLTALGNYLAENLSDVKIVDGAVDFQNSFVPGMNILTVFRLIKQGFKLSTPTLKKAFQAITGENGYFDAAGRWVRRRETWDWVNIPRPMPMRFEGGNFSVREQQLIRVYNRVADFESLLMYDMLFTLASPRVVPRIAHGVSRDYLQISNDLLWMMAKCLLRVDYLFRSS